MLKKKKINKKPPINKAPVQAKQAQPSLLQDFIKLLLKIVCILLAFVLVFSFIFGAFRYNSLSMNPAVKDGDLVITYR